MGIPVLILGESGSGKSRSLKNFNENEIVVFNVASKPLPFKKQLLKRDGASYRTILNGLAKQSFNRYAIDDSQYLMAFDMFDRAKETGYGKFTDCAVNFYNLVQYVIKNLPADTIVYFLHHVETTDTGKIKAKTSGKMLDNQLTLEGLFSIVLLCQSDNEEHRFITQSGGYSSAKSPEDMFPLEIENDLKAVDNTIREYWGLSMAIAPTSTVANNKPQIKGEEV